MRRRWQSGSRCGSAPTQHRPLLRPVCSLSHNWRATAQAAAAKALSQEPFPKSLINTEGLITKLQSAADIPASSDSRRGSSAPASVQAYYSPPLSADLGAFSLLTNALKPRKCRTCHGGGQLTCTTCNGRGKMGGLFTGLPLTACTDCATRGRRPCAKCEATGLANHWLWQPVNEPGAWGARGE